MVSQANQLQAAEIREFYEERLPHVQAHGFQWTPEIACRIWVNQWAEIWRKKFLELGRPPMREEYMSPK